MAYIPKEIKLSVIKNANGKCERCGDIENKMEFHHRDYNPKNNLLNNLDYLCKICHKNVHTFLFKKLTATPKCPDQRYTSYKYLLKDKLTLASYFQSTLPKKMDDDKQALNILTY